MDEHSFSEYSVAALNRIISEKTGTPCTIKSKPALVKKAAELWANIDFAVLWEYLKSNDIIIAKLERKQTVERTRAQLEVANKALSRSIGMTICNDNHGDFPVPSKLYTVVGYQFRYHTATLCCWGPNEAIESSRGLVVTTLANINLATGGDRAGSFGNDDNYNFRFFPYLLLFIKIEEVIGSARACGIIVDYIADNDDIIRDYDTAKIEIPGIALKARDAHFREEESDRKKAREDKRVAKRKQPEESDTDEPDNNNNNNNNNDDEEESEPAPKKVKREDTELEAEESSSETETDVDSASEAETNSDSDSDNDEKMKTE